MIGSLGQPILFMIALGVGFGPIFKRAGGGNYMTFLAPGIISQTVLFTALFTGIEVIWDRQFGFLKETLVAPVSRINIMIGRTLGGATIATFQAFIVFILALILGFRPYRLSLLPIALVFVLLISIFFTALGTAIASLLEDMQGFQLIMNFLVMPLFFLSGALFPLQGLPSAFLLIASLDPLSYGVDGLRYALVGTFHFGFVTDFSVLGTITLITLFIGGYLFSKIQI